jgi:hypothetical protein
MDLHRDPAFDRVGSLVLVWAVSDLGVASRLIDGLYSKCISSSKGNPDSRELKARSIRDSAYLNTTG